MSPTTLIPGTRLGPFEIVALLGVGGMGEVYRATDTDLRRQVAIKVLLQPQMLPGGTALLMTIAKMADGPTRWDKAQIVVQKIATGQRTIIVNGGADARYVPTGHLTYAVGRQMMWRSLLQV